MVIRSFNFWFIIVPLTLLFAIMLAILSITEEDSKAKKRISNKVWTNGMICYCTLVWVGLSKLFIAESLLGMIERLGGYASDAADAADRARSTFWIIAAIWAVALFFGATYIRRRYYKLINYACDHGYSKADRTRRRRHKREQREEEKERQKRLKLAEEGKLCIVDFNNNGTYVRRTPKHDKASTGKITAAQNESKDAIGSDNEQHTIEHRVQEEFEKYEIGKIDNLEQSYTDPYGKRHPMSHFLKDGICEYFVGVNCKDEDVAPLYLGSGTLAEAEENLRRHLREKIEKQVCPKHAAI